jgi:hypothetical protein
VAQKEPSRLAIVFLGMWYVLFLPWLVMLLFSTMAFDGGHKAEAWCFAGSLLTYPITVVLGTVFSRNTAMTLLPLVSIVAVLLSVLWRT